MGLTSRNRNGIRLMPDGRPIEIVVETTGESAEQTAVLQIIAPSWKKAGIGLVVRPYERTVLRNRAYAGESVMTVWTGLENGVPTPAANARRAGAGEAGHAVLAEWGQYVQTKGKTGEAATSPRRNCSRCTMLDRDRRRRHSGGHLAPDARTRPSSR